MSKEDFSTLLHSLECTVNEGITSEDKQNSYPRIVYWPYAERDIVASGVGIANLVTYQLSLFDRVPQGEKYKTMRKLLREKNITPEFFHEYVENDPVFEKAWHTYCAVDVLEEIEDE